MRASLDLLATSAFLPKPIKIRRRTVVLHKSFLIHEVRVCLGDGGLGLMAQERAQHHARLLERGCCPNQASRVESMTAEQRLGLSLYTEHGTHDTPTPSHTQTSVAAHATGALARTHLSQPHVSTMWVCRRIQHYRNTNYCTESVPNSDRQKVHGNTSALCGSSVFWRPGMPWPMCSWLGCIPRSQRPGSAAERSGPRSCVGATRCPRDRWPCHRRPLEQRGPANPCLCTSGHSLRPGSAGRAGAARSARRRSPPLSGSGAPPGSAGRQKGSRRTGCGSWACSLWANGAVPLA